MDILHDIYALIELPYMLLILAVTEFVKILFLKTIKTESTTKEGTLIKTEVKVLKHFRGKYGKHIPFHPKYFAIIVATLLAYPVYLYYHKHVPEYSMVKLVITYTVTTTSYDYLIKYLMKLLPKNEEVT